MDSIDAKGFKFLQQNNPGNDGYGQIGLKGETGKDGNSVYFTPYILSKSYNECITLIKEGKELSNNPNYDSKRIIYKVNDLIVDKHGDVYILKSWSSIKTDNVTEEHDEPFKIEKLNNIFTQGNNINNLNCNLNVVFSDNKSEFYYKRQNDNYLGEYNNISGSPYIYHRDRYQDTICGGWVSFSIPQKDQEYANYIYKYVLLLPNGQRIEKVTNTSSCIIFLDNRYFYTCRFDAMHENNITNFLRSKANYESIYNTKEYTPEFTYNLLTIGIEYCKAYVDVTNRDTHTVYRKYAEKIERDGIEDINEY